MSIADKLTTIAENTSKVYEAGKKDFEDSLVNYITNNGSRTYYSQAFRTAAFYKDNLIDFKGRCTPTDPSYMFYNMKGTHVPLGVDLSNINTDSADILNNLFAYCAELLEIPDLNIPTPKKYSATYGYCYKLHTIHGKIRTDENTVFSASAFREDHALQNMEIEGIIGQNNFNVQWSKKLSGASIVSIIEALSTTTSGLTVTLSQTAVDNMVFPITSTRTDAEGNEYTTTYNSWIDLAGDGIEGSPNEKGIRPNWTISLI